MTHFAAYDGRFGYGAFSLNDAMKLATNPTALLKELQRLEQQATYWKAEAEKRAADVQAGIRDPAYLIEWIEIRTTVSPWTKVEDPLKSGSGGPSPMSQIKPALLVKFKGLTKPTTIAPWGEPTETNWDYIQAGGIAFAALAVYGAYKLIW